MKGYVFFHLNKTPELAFSEKEVLVHLERIAMGTTTEDLVVAVYLIPGSTRTRGTAYVSHWMTPAHFVTRRGHWRFTQYYSIPSDLPSQFKLIRLRLDPRQENYPKTELDSYLWKFHYASFWDQLAFLFAHELHHFRRYHLGLHAREGEHSANCWALRHVQNLGYRVSGVRIAPPRKKTHGLFKNTLDFDRYEKFRTLKPGTLLCIVHDPREKYTGQWARLIRPVRKGARRAVVETRDGKQWRWPLAWLKWEFQNPSCLDFSERLF